jgi:HK97 gp10 family phage protein
MGTIKGLEKLLSQFDALKDIDIISGILGAGYILQAESQKNAPVDTAFLENSPTTEIVSPDLVEMVFHANYAVYQEMGTPKMKAHPYVRPAIESEKDNMIKYLKSYIDTKIKGVQ